MYPYELEYLLTFTATVGTWDAIGVVPEGYRANF